MTQASENCMPMVTQPCPDIFHSMLTYHAKWFGLPNYSLGMCKFKAQVYCTKPRVKLHIVPLLFLENDLVRAGILKQKEC